MGRNFVQGLGRFIQREHWKQTALLGWIAAVVAIFRYAITGEVATEMTYLVGVLIFGSLAWQGVKRGTEFRPEERARAEQIRNGEGGFGNGE